SVSNVKPLAPTPMYCCQLHAARSAVIATSNTTYLRMCFGIPDLEAVVARDFRPARCMHHRRGERSASPFENKADVEWVDSQCAERRLYNVQTRLPPRATWLANSSLEAVRR